MYDLGLQRFPPLPVILKMASGTDEVLRNLALHYLLENMEARYSTTWNPLALPQVSFIPALKADGSKFLATPGEVRRSESGSYR